MSNVPGTKEQTAIGNFFRTLDDVITLHQRKLDWLRELKKGYLQQMFLQAGERVPRVRFAGSNFTLQTIISTHSAHIVSQCDFNDIKYLYRDIGDNNSLSSRSMKALHNMMVTGTEKSERRQQEQIFRFV